MFAGLASWLFDSAGLTPHGFCLLWDPSLIWLHATSDLAIACAYYTIPLALAIVARRRKDLMFRPVFWLFAAFIMLCGTTHWLGLLTLWVPAYGLEGVVKFATAIASVGTAIVLWRLLPQALALPSPAQLQAVNEALLESEARHRASFEHSPVPMHTLDGAGRITGVSDSWLSLLCYEREEVVGRFVTDFQPPGALSWSAEAMLKLMQDGESQIERCFLKRDGSVVDALVSARTERGGEQVWAVCVLIDNTARRRAEEALRATEERLHQAQKMDAVGQLTGGIAHDFNNMLQGIAGGIELVERRLAQGQVERVGEYLGKTRQFVNRAAFLTQRLLAFARRSSLQPRPTDPDTLVRGMEELIVRAVGPTITLELGLTNGRWRALCDPNQLESALLNLAINARDAMPDGGTLLLATADRRLTRADLQPGDEVGPGDFVEIAVTDNGQGMPPDVVARAFEPFFTTKPIGQGTGLGLSQVYGFVRQSGGIIRLESTPGNGTTVRLFLPRCRVAGDADLPPDVAFAEEQRTPVPQPGARVLVVDDEDVVRTQIADRLRELGLTVLEAADGTAGLRIVQSEAALDVLVTDVGLPGLNGRQLAEAARQCRPGLPVLLITGYAGTSLDDGSLAPGMEVLRKPFPLDVLAEKVRAALLQATPVA